MTRSPCKYSWHASSFLWTLIKLNRSNHTTTLNTRENAHKAVDRCPGPTRTKRFDSPGNEAHTRREIDCKSSAPRLRLWSSLAPPCPALYCWMALPDIVWEIAIVLCSLGAFTKHFLRREFGIFIIIRKSRISFPSIDLSNTFQCYENNRISLNDLFSILKYRIIPSLHLTFVKYHTYRITLNLLLFYLL